MLPDWRIITSKMLDPIVVEQDKSAGPSFGPSPYGYDCKLGDKYIPELIKNPNYDPEDIFNDTSPPFFKNTKKAIYIATGRSITIQPKEFILAETIEHFKMPDNIVGLVFDKSTYARKGIAAFNTVIEPGWKGCLTLELVNHSNEPQELIIGAGIVQVIFFENSVFPNKPYDGKYQGDEGVQVAK